MSHALEDLKVLELGQIYNGPYAGLMFAQLGADVIKLEPLDGERLRFRSKDAAESHEFMMLNSNKRSIAVDAKHPEGRQAMLDLIDTVDVVIENFAPGAMKRLGLDPVELCERNPRLVYATGKGYGLDGPYAHMAAMDLTVQAMSGTIASTGFPDGPPVKAGPAFIDFSGGIHLFAAAMSALYQRERTGKGQIVEVSMHDTVYPMLASALGGIYNEPKRELPERTGNRHSGLAVAPYNVYKAADGWLAIISVAEKHFEAVMTVIGAADAVTDDRFSDRFRRVANMDDLDALIEGWTETQDRWDAVAELQAAGVPCAPVLTVAEVADDPHLRHRGMIQTVTHPTLGSINVPGCPLRLADSPADDLRVAPPLANATDSVLADLCGYSEDRLKDLRRDLAIG